MAARLQRPFWDRNYKPLSLAVLALAAFNLTFRLGHEVVTEWDESLYAISAWEMARSHCWIASTFMGSLDYYNTKPPLNLWLISLSFKTFGPSLVSLRLWSAMSAWTTVALFQNWVRCAIGSGVALTASLVLSTTFGFIYDHSGRSANTDALFTLLVLATVVTLWTAEDHRWRLVWVGPLAAAVFLLRGMAVLMPLSIALAVEVWRAKRRHSIPWAPIAVALVLFSVPVGAWLVARWRLDEWLFISRLFSYDFAARALTVIENHPGTPLYYLNILQRNQFDWLLLGVVSAFLIRWPALTPLATFWRGNELKMVIGSWAAITLLIPTFMRTKLSWYLDPFYPPFALGVGYLFVRAVSSASKPGTHRLRAALVVVFIAMFVTAESRLVWYSFHRRSLAASSQGLLLAERTTLTGRRVFRDHWTHSETFLLKGIIGAEQQEAATLDDFLRDSNAGDYLVAGSGMVHPAVELVKAHGRNCLYRRRKIGG